MGKIIKTPLAVVYVDEKKRLSIGENLDLSRSSEVWGFCFYEEISKCNLFISKNNGPNLTFKQADKWAYEQFEPYFMEGNEVILYGGLPHYEEMLVLFFGYYDYIAKMLKIFRKNGITADDFYEDEYLVYSDEVFLNPYDVHIRRFLPHQEVNVPFSYKAMRTDDGGEKILSFKKETAPYDRKFHTRLFLHQFS